MAKKKKSFIAKAKKLTKKKVPLWAVGVTLLVIAVACIAVLGFTQREPPGQAQVVTQSLLEDIIDVSNVSTYEAVYNGIVTVMNEKNEDKVDFHVSYEAKVKVGIDFNRIKVELDEELKRIIVTVPTVELQEPEVEISSLDFIFINDKANTATVTERAYKACNADAAEESKEQKAIYDLAQEAAINFVDALIRPFVEQLDSTYDIEIRQEGTV